MDAEPLIMRFGTQLPPALPIRRQIKLGVFLERIGYDTLWFPDHMLFPDLSGAPDPWTLMAAVAERTSRARIGTSVTDPHRLHPAVMAQKVATLDQLSKGRIILGLGSGEAMNLDPYGIPWERKVGRLREAITVLRGLLDSPEPFSFQGDFYTLKKARLGVRPYKNRRIPIYLAALGPQMQKVCGQLCDGWIPVVVPCEHFDHYFAGVAEAARAAGRDPDKLERVASVPFAIHGPGEFSRAALEEVARPYGLTLVWPAALERVGIPWNPPAHLTVNYLNVNPCDEEHVRLYEELQNWIPIEMIERFVSTGGLEEIARVFSDFAAQGATELSVTNASPDPLTTTALLASKVFPRFTGRRPTLTARALSHVFPLLKKLGLLPKMPGPRDWGKE